MRMDLGGDGSGEAVKPDNLAYCDAGYSVTSLKATAVTCGSTAAAGATQVASHIFFVPAGWSPH